MPRALSPRPAGKGRPSASRTKPQLPRDLVDEIRQTTRPTNQEQAIARLSRAVELLERGDSGAAIAEARKAKEAAPRSSSVREVLGMAYYGQERWQEAMTELKAYRRITGRADQNHIIADCMRGIGRPGEAVALAEEELRAKVPNEAKAEAVIVASSALADQGPVRRGAGLPGAREDPRRCLRAIHAEALVREGRHPVEGRASR